MSSLFNKFISKLFAILIIVAFIIAFREKILTDSNTALAFGELLGTLPFAKAITDVICEILQYQYGIPIISSSTVISDILRLAVMACIQPAIVGVLSVIFLKVPEGDYRVREEYMEGAGYRAKEMILTVITTMLFVWESM